MNHPPAVRASNLAARWTCRVQHHASLLLLAGLAACGSAPIEREGGSPGMSSPGKPSPAPLPPPPSDPRTSPPQNEHLLGAPRPPLLDQPGVAPLRRLSRLEYANTLRDLLPVAAVAEIAQAEQLELRDREDLSFHTGAPIEDITEAHTLLEIAEDVAHAAVFNLPQLLPPSCASSAAAAAEDTCARGFVATVARRAYRRPLSATESEALNALFAARRARGDNLSDALEVTLQAILQSPQLLYHWESDAPPVRDGRLVRIGPWEIAARLSYGLWASMPDQTLFDAAAAGQLGTPDQIEAQARRLLADPRVDTMLRDFHLQWLRLDTLPDAFRELPDFRQLAAAMLDETGAFAVGVYRSGHPKLGDLFNATNAWVDAPLAQLYGLPAPTDPGVHPVELPEGQRAGILTRAAFLARHASWDSSNPVERGVTVLRQVLCMEIPHEPPDLPISPPTPPLPHATTRQRYEQHASLPCARACHGLIDPVGFAFEHYDGLGAYRTHENGELVDASGTLQLFAGPQPFSDAIQMSRQLADSAEARACMERQWLRYLTGRQEGVGDQAALADAHAAFGRTNLDLVELIVALTRTHAFSHRSPNDGEVLP